MSKTKTNVHSNFKCKNISKDEKSKKNDILRIVCVGIFQVANVFWVWKIYSFVAYLILYRLVYNTK